MKRKLKWTAVVLAVSLLGFGTALFLWPRDRITVEFWKEIQLGMTEKEVAAILGSPGMNEEEYLAQLKGKLPQVAGLAVSEPAGGLFHVAGQDRFWIGHRGCIEIRFDEEGHVGWKGFRGWRSDFWAGLRDWLGW